MLSALQSAAVQSLQLYRALDGTVDAGTLAPKVIEPYGGQLLNPDRLVTVAPALYVELDKGSRQRQGTSNVFAGVSRTDLVGAARNAAHGDQAHHDGAALMAWAMAWAEQAEIVVGRQVLAVDKIDWRRYAMDREVRTWTGVITLTWSLTT